MILLVANGCCNCFSSVRVSCETKSPLYRIWQCTRYFFDERTNKWMLHHKISHSSNVYHVSSTYVLFDITILSENFGIFNRSTHMLVTCKSTVDTFGNLLFLVVDIYRFELRSFLQKVCRVHFHVRFNRKERIKQR